MQVPDALERVGLDPRDVVVVQQDVVKMLEAGDDGGVSLVAPVLAGVVKALQLVVGKVSENRNAKS